MNPWRGYQSIQSIELSLIVFYFPLYSESVSEEDLQAMFTEHGGQISNFRFFPKDRRMALLQLETTEEALICLIVRYLICLLNLFNWSLESYLTLKNVKLCGTLNLNRKVKQGTLSQWTTKTLTSKSRFETLNYTSCTGEVIRMVKYRHFCRPEDLAFGLTFNIL